MSHTTNTANNTDATMVGVGKSTAEVTGAIAGSFVQGMVRGTSSTLKGLGFVAEAIENVAILGVKLVHKKVTQNSKTEQYKVTKAFSAGFQMGESLHQMFEEVASSKVKEMSIDNITL